MKRHRSHSSKLLGIAAFVLPLALGACGSGTGEASLRSHAGADLVEQHRPLTLADIAARCAHDGPGPGVAVVDKQLRDANTSVDLPDCVLHLEQGADVHLANVRITGGILNIHDREVPASTNRVELQLVTIDVAALLIELNDADDSLDAEATRITTAQGIAIRVAGTRDGANAGGSIRVIGSKLLSTDPDATIHVLASEHSGTIRLVSTTVDTQGPLTVLASDCEALLDGRRLDCSTAAVEADVDR